MSYVDFLKNLVIPRYIIMKQEKYGYRCSHYSIRHRKYGEKLLCQDIDMIEYDHLDRPLAIIETKHANVSDINTHESQMKLCKNLADAAKLPAFALVYYYTGKNGQIMHHDTPHDALSHVDYFIVPLNEFAKAYFTIPQMISERQYVEFLYALRKKQMPQDLPVYHTIKHKGKAVL